MKSQLENKSLTLNFIPIVSVSFRERSLDFPLVEEGDIYEFLFETLRGLGLTQMESFLIGLCIVSLLGYIFCQLINHGAYHLGWVRAGTDKLLMNHKEILERRVSEKQTLESRGRVVSRDYSTARWPYDPKHPGRATGQQFFHMLITTSVPFFIFVGISSLITLIVMVICGLSGVIIEHASLSQAVVEQEQQLIGLRSALESLYSEEVIRSAKHADLLKSLFEVNKEVALLQKHIYYLQGTPDLSILKNAEELARSQETVDSLLTYKEEKKLRSLLTSLEKRLCTTLQVIGTDSQ